MRKERVPDREALRAMLPPMPEGFAESTERLLARLPRGKDEIIMKKKISLGLAAALLLALLAVSALAAANGWDVTAFLFGSRNEGVETLVTDISASATDGQVTLTVNSALCDGETLALDWTVRNARPESPTLLLVDQFTANGVRIFTDGTDSFDGQWLPGWWNEGEMQDGENITLPETITGDTLRVDMRVGVYQPKKPIWRMAAFDAQEAHAKLDAGYFVLPEGDGYVTRDEAEPFGVAWCVGGVSERMASEFDRTELHIAFELDLAAGRASRVALETAERHAFTEFTAQIDKAVLTPVGLYLNWRVSYTSEEKAERKALGLWMDGEYVLTDAGGAALPLPHANFVSMGLTRADGGVDLVWEYAWFGVSRADLPERFFITFLTESGEQRWRMEVRVPPKA